MKRDPIRVLGIESSCDETAAAVVEGGARILSSIVATQHSLHAPFRGIVPEIASRSHISRINRLIEEALLLGWKKANPRSGRRALPSAPRLLEEWIDAVAFTQGPGLVGSLLIGKMTAEALGWSFRKAVLGIHHLEAHLYAGKLEHPDLEPPFLGLVVSGGHTDLIAVEDFGEYRVLGRTRDDAAGECLDKAAKILGLGYPGGPAMDRLARRGNPKAFEFPRAFLPESWDFSFSGLKTALLYFTKEHPVESLSLPDACASFQEALVDVLVRKALSAARRLDLERIVLGGGVAANSRLRARLASAARADRRKLFLPSPSFCTDNAAMIAGLAFHKLKAQKELPRSWSVESSLPIRNWR